MTSHHCAYGRACIDGIKVGKKIHRLHIEEFNDFQDFLIKFFKE